MRAIALLLETFELDKVAEFANKSKAIIPYNSNFEIQQNRMQVESTHKAIAHNQTTYPHVWGKTESSGSIQFQLTNSMAIKHVDFYVEKERTTETKHRNSIGIVETKQDDKKN